MSHQLSFISLPVTCPPSSVIAIIVTVISIFITPASTVIDAGTTLGCHVRRYEILVTKPPVYDNNGAIIRCSGWVPVNSCWGRCDTSEIGDYLMPFKISHHTVCTYTERIYRMATLPDCEGYPDPTELVFDAAGCECRICNSDYTSCENLNG